MIETKTHDGWTNYETWAVKRWLDKDQLECWRDITKEIWEAAEPYQSSSKSQAGLWELGHQLKRKSPQKTFQPPASRAYMLTCSTLPYPRSTGVKSPTLC